MTSLDIASSLRFSLHTLVFHSSCLSLLVPSHLRAIVGRVWREHLLVLLLGVGQPRRRSR